METTRNIIRHDNAIAEAEQAFRDAGFTFERVSSCPDANCEVCAPGATPATLRTVAVAA